MDLFEHGAYRSTDPETSKSAANSVNISKLEEIVIAALTIYGPMTSEETTNILNRPIDSITPRFKPLLEKRMIVELHEDGKPVTRPGSSGRQRQVYAIQLDMTQWRERPKVKTKQQTRIEELESALIEIKDIASVSEGGEFYIMLVNKVLKNG